MIAAAAPGFHLFHSLPAAPGRPPLPRTDAELAAMLDFHAAVAALAAHPDLQRALGLVLDVTVSADALPGPTGGELVLAVERVEPERARLAVAAAADPAPDGVRHQIGRRPGHAVRGRPGRRLDRGRCGRLPPAGRGVRAGAGRRRRRRPGVVRRGGERGPRPGHGWPAGAAVGRCRADGQ